MAKGVGYFWNSELQQRKTGFSCPEIPERCQVLSPQAIFELAGVSGLPCEFQSRDVDVLVPVHDRDYIAKVQNANVSGIRYLDAGETLVTPDLFPQSLLSASAGCQAIDQIMDDRLSAGFCAIRPPGHHANRYRGLGFCVFNNAAVAAAYGSIERSSQT